jgi:hypothetical protein
MMRLDSAGLPIRSKPKSMHDIQRLAILELKSLSARHRGTKRNRAPHAAAAGGTKAQTEANRVVTEKSQLREMTRRHSFGDRGSAFSNRPFSPRSMAFVAWGQIIAIWGSSYPANTMSAAGPL